MGPAVVGMINNHPAVGYSRLTDGHILCQLCFNYFWPCELHEPEPGVREDVCAPCGTEDKEVTQHFEELLARSSSTPPEGWPRLPPGVLADIDQRLARRDDERTQE